MYTIDLNEKIITRNVQELLASGDDSSHSQIRVSQNGRVYIQHVHYGGDDLEGVLFRAEDTFCQGNGYVGSEAAEDPVWVQQVYQDLLNLQTAWEDLKTDWPKPTTLLYAAKRPYALHPPMVPHYLGPYAPWTKLAERYGGLKTYIEYPAPDEYGAIDLSRTKIHVF